MAWRITAAVQSRPSIHSLARTSRLTMQRTHPRSAPRAIVPVLLAYTVAFSACADAAPDKSVDSSAATATSFQEAAWTAPREADIPNDSLGASIRRGLYLLRHTSDSLPNYVTSRLNCTSCHQDDGIRPTAAPLTGSHARFPKYMGRSGAVIGLGDRVNYCFTRSLAGSSVPLDSREMTDILAYLAFISRDVPVGVRIAGADGLIPMPKDLDGNAERGKLLYAEKTCVVCHGANGEGNGPLPPLWGPKSYSIGASMSRMERAASFIRHNMPQTAPGTLTDQEAFDLAAYVTSQPRPDSPGKELDFPMGGAPADTPFDTKGHEGFRPPPLLPRVNPGAAVVPNPRVVSPSGR